jgi:hypothetical protein
VGRIALRAFAYHGTPIETSTSKIIQASWHDGRSHAIILGELPETQGKYMSHHDYGPDWGFSKEDARLDLTDGLCLLQTGAGLIRNYATERSHMESNLLGTQTTAEGAS